MYRDRDKITKRWRIQNAYEKRLKYSKSTPLCVNTFKPKSVLKTKETRMTCCIKTMWVLITLNMSYVVLF